MGSNSGRYDDTVVVNFPAEGVVAIKRFKKHMKKITYTNIRCNVCGEWWMMICIDSKTLYCPYCSANCEVEGI
jgi:hypothetical protein